MPQVRRSFVLNIKESAVNGERHPYVIELILALRKQGWRWVDEYCWHKKNCYPGKWPNRFRDSWERLLHFTLNKRFKMRQEAVKVPMGAWKNSRLRNLSQTDRTQRRIEKTATGSARRSRTGSGARRPIPRMCCTFRRNADSRVTRRLSLRPCPTGSFRLFTDPGDTVLDPLRGFRQHAGRRPRAWRRGIGIDTSQEYCDLMAERLRT